MASARWTRWAPSRRGAGRGHARAAVAAAADTASADGCEQVFMVTDGADWPQHLYRRLGFDEIGATYEFLKLPISSRP